MTQRNSKRWRPAGIMLRGAALLGLMLGGAANSLAQEDPARLDELVVGRITDMNVPDPNAIGVSQFAFNDNVFDTLIRYEDSLEPTPSLATSWAWNDDKTQLTLNLREGVKFHSGNAFTAEDVLFTLERVLDPSLGSGQLASMAKWIVNAEAPDDHTVVLSFDQPRANFMDMLSFLYIADKETLENGDPNQNVNGTGPYRFVDWSPGQGFELERNPDYFEETTGPERIRTVVISDAQALAAQLQAGSIDIAEGLSERSLAPFASNPDYSLVQNNFGPEYYYLGMNVTNPPFDDKRVRQAFVYALDRDRFVQSTLQGYGEATSAPWPPQSPAYDEASRDRYDFDLEKARSLLDEAGVDELDVRLLTANAWQPLLEHAQQYQADLAKIGVNASIDVVDVGRWVQEVARDHTADIWTGGFAFSQYSPESLFAMAAPWRLANTMPQFESEEFTSLVQAALSEPDDEKRLDIIAELTAYLQDQAFSNPIARRVLVLVEGPRVEGSEYLITGFISFKNVEPKA